MPYDQLISNALASRTYQAALVDLNLARTPDPDPYPFWHQAEATGGQNYSQWNNQAASEYLEQARTETDSRCERAFIVIFRWSSPRIAFAATVLPVYNYGVSAQVHGVQLALPMYDTSDRLAFMANGIW